MSADPAEPVAAPADKILDLVETAVYAVLGVLLAAAAIAVLGSVGYHFITEIDDGIEKTATKTLDGLLLVFILLELLAGVRATMAEHRLVAEPFLIVGITASIKEIVLASLKASGGSQQEFENAMVEIGVLAGVVVLLAGAGYLVRRKEREPNE